MIQKKFIWKRFFQFILTFAFFSGSFLFADIGEIIWEDNFNNLDNQQNRRLDKHCVYIWVDAIFT